MKEGEEKEYRRYTWLEQKWHLLMELLGIHKSGAFYMYIASCIIVNQDMAEDAKHLALHLRNEFGNDVDAILKYADREIEVRSAMTERAVEEIKAQMRESGFEIEDENDGLPAAKPENTKLH